LQGKLTTEERSELMKTLLNRASLHRPDKNIARGTFRNRTRSHSNIDTSTSTHPTSTSIYQTTSSTHNLNTNNNTSTSTYQSSTSTSTIIKNEETVYLKIEKNTVVSENKVEKII
jgi:tRNA G10  N-methylase Trm11